MGLTLISGKGVSDHALDQLCSVHLDGGPALSLVKDADAAWTTQRPRIPDVGFRGLEVTWSKRG